MTLFGGLPHIWNKQSDFASKINQIKRRGKGGGGENATEKNLQLSSRNYSETLLKSATRQKEGGRKRRRKKANVRVRGVKETDLPHFINTLFRSLLVFLLTPQSPHLPRTSSGSKNYEQGVRNLRSEGFLGSIFPNVASPKTWNQLFLMWQKWRKKKLKLFET